ncbi:MAG TPA: hypothetical protein VGE98_01300 [Thermoanaerobaculia bacterium]
MTNEQIERMRWLLRTAIRVSDFTHREIEINLGWSGGSLSRLFSGEVELKIHHVLDILGVIQLPPGEFFQIAFPTEVISPSPVLKKLQEAMRSEPSVETLGEGTERGTQPSAEQLTQRLVETVRQVFAELDPPPER